MKSKRHYVILIMSIVSFFLLLAGGTYAWLVFGSTVGDNTQKVEATCFSVNYEGDFVNTLIGDANEDGIINQNDVQVVRDIISGKIIPNAHQSKLADADQDGFINLNDINMIKSIMYGDANTDGTIDSADVQFIQDIVVNGTSWLTELQKKLADVNQDGDYGVGDIVLINSLISGEPLDRDFILFPSKTDRGGLYGKVTLSIKEECNVSANGYISINIADSTSDKYFTNGALRYSLYDKNNTTLISSGTLDNYGVITLNSSNPIALTNTDSTYYVYVWLDGTKVDNSYLNLPFSATMYASAIQIES